MVQGKLLRDLRAINHTYYDPRNLQSMTLTNLLYESTINLAQLFGTASVDELIHGYEYMLNLCGIMEDSDKILEITVNALALQPSAYFTAVFYNYRTAAYVLKKDFDKAREASQTALIYARQSSNEQLIALIEGNLKCAEWQIQIIMNDN